MRSTEPFPYAVIDNAFNPAHVVAADSTWPDIHWEGWGVHYNTPLEKGKRACNDWAQMPAACQLLLSAMAVRPFYQEVGVDGAVPDCGLWGGGMHSMSAGSHLDLHEDSDSHPRLGWCRRVNAILFVNQEWHEDWGGNLEFWDQELTRPVVRIQPACNRLVVFAIGDGTYHGVPDLVRCPPEVQRKSLAMFWFTPPLPGQAFKRPRANFVARPGDHDPVKEALREARRRFDA